MSVTMLNPYRYAVTGPIVSDSFDRANNASLGSADTGQVWTNYVGACGIDNNQAWAPTLVSGTAIALLDAGVADGTFSIAVSSRPLTGNRDDALLFRAAGGSDFLMARHNAAVNLVTLHKCVAGSFTQLADAALTEPDPYTVTVVASGANITVSIDGVQYINHTLSAGDQTAFGANTLVGMRVRNINARLDNLLVTA